MKTQRLLLMTALLLSLAAAAAAAGPVATPFEGAPLSPQREIAPAAEKAFGDPADFRSSALAGAAYLVGMQADITEDNAGNGDPDADPDDGGWDWVRVPFEHSASASATNIYGATVQGLYNAYLIDPLPSYFTAMKDAADHIVAVGPTVIRSGPDVSFLLRFADLPACPDPSYYRAGAQAIWNRQITTYGTMTALAQFIRDARAGQGYPNGIIPWDISAWAEAAMLMHAAFPGSGHDAEGTAIAEVLYQDSFAANPGYFEPFGHSQGYTTDWSNVDYWWFSIGVASLIKTFAVTGAHTAEIPGLQTLMLACQYADGAFSDQYGAPTEINDRDWQDSAYCLMAIAQHLPSNATTQDPLYRAATWLASTQHTSGAWVYGSGNHYPEVGGEATAAVAMGWMAAGASVTALLGDAGPINCGDTQVVTFRYEPGDATPALRGYDITFQVTGNVSFGSGNIVDLGNLGTPHWFAVVDNLDGTWTVSDAILGPTSGLQTAADFFTVTLTPTASGQVDVDILDYRLRTLDNAPIFADMLGASFMIDCDAPDPVTDIAVAPGHQKLKVNWTDSPSGDVVAYEVWLGLWTDGNVGVSAYPEYDDLAAYNPAARPASRAAAAGSGGVWVLGAVYTVGTDTKPFVVPWVDRGIYTVEVFAMDSAGNYSAVAPDGNDLATNYWLGDVSDGVPGQYDGNVDISDITMLGTYFGTNPGVGTLGAETDVGPTHDNSRVGLPLTDSRVDFEDLMIFAMNYGFVSPTNKAVLAAAPLLAWSQAEDGVWTLSLSAPCAALKGLRLTAAVPPGAARVEPGALLARQTAPHFLRNLDALGLDVSLAILGDGVGIAGDGELLRVTLPAGVDPAAVSITARGLDNADLALALERPQTPAAFRLAQNHPNPFNPMTTISYALPTAQHVSLVVYSVDGRRVRTLVDAAAAAGVHEAVWDGRDDAGRQVASGAYFYRLDAGPYTRTNKMVLMK